MEQAGLSFAPSSLCPRRREILLTDVQNVHKTLSMTTLRDHPRDLQTICNPEGASLSGNIILDPECIWYKFSEL